MARKVASKAITRDQIHRLVDRLPEHDIVLAYSMLRRFIAGPRRLEGDIVISPEDPITPVLLEEQEDHEEGFDDPALEEAFGYVVKNYNDTIKNLVNR
jgi:hypothetical protein